MSINTHQTLTRTVAPTARIVTLVEAKQHLHVDTAADDARIQLLIDAVEMYLDGANGILGRAIRPQTWRTSAPGFPNEIGTISNYSHDVSSYPDAWRLPLPPTITVDAIEYLDPAGQLQTWDAANYVVMTDEEQGIIPLTGVARSFSHQGALVMPASGKTWPTTIGGRPDAARITFQCGYSDPTVGTEMTPIQQLRAIALLILQGMYDNPGTMDIPEAADTLLAPMRARYF